MEGVVSPQIPKHGTTYLRIQGELGRIFSFLVFLWNGPRWPQEESELLFRDPGDGVVVGCGGLVATGGLIVYKSGLAIEASSHKHRS